MKLPVRLLTVALLFVPALAQNAAQEQSSTPEQLGDDAQKFEYQSDIARLMRVVVSHLYHDRDVFIRELLSNSNDALEKTRLLSLTNPSILEGAPQLNVTVLADPEGGRILIRDSGIGMSKLALQENLGTIARSGTSEFLEKLEKGDGGNLIGQFGLGFYSSFLVADRVTVASKATDDAVQHIFESDANAASYKIAEDPRGNTLGRGTEITLWIKEDAKEYLDIEKLRGLIRRHSEYASVPIYLWAETTVEEPIQSSAPDGEEQLQSDDEVKVEEVEKAVQTKKVTKGAWELVNERPPLWMRDPKEVTEEEYEDFFVKTFKEDAAPVAWSHFKGDAGSTTFRSLIYVPASFPHDFYSKTYQSLDALKLFVRRVFITSDVGPDFLPKWLNWVKVFIDADDLPLNVGRDSLQKSKALGQIKRNLVKRTLDLFINMARNDPDKFAELYAKAGVALKLGAVDDKKNRPRLVKLLRFESSATQNATSLDEVLSRRKKGQEQLFYMAGAGLKKEDLEKSPFVETLIARGYEVLYFTEPMDEMIASSVGSYEGLKFQDVAKKGLKFGDEDEDLGAKAEEASLKTTFEPLTKYLKEQLSESVNDVLISNRLTNSPCLVVTDAYAWTGNMERLMAAQNAGGTEDFMRNFMRTQKRTFEINPKHPLIEALLEKVEEAENDESVHDELKETTQVLWQTALVKSGFSVPDPNTYFSQIETLLRRSLGVSEAAKAKADVKPAPPVETGPIRPGAPDFDPTQAEEANVPAFERHPDEWANWADLKEGFDAHGGAGLSAGEASEITEPVVEKIAVPAVEGGEKTFHDEL